MKKIAVFLSLTVAMFLIAGTTGAMAAPDESPIRVGVVLPLTGNPSKFGNLEKNPTKGEPWIQHIFRHSPHWPDR
jgi:hypothetical protein